MVFNSECWRFTYDETNGLNVNGIVYNEMKGAIENESDVF